MTEQTRPNGTLRHLLTLEGLTKTQIEALLSRAQKFVKPIGEPPVQKKSLAGITVANLFTEPSTRTRTPTTAWRPSFRGRGTSATAPRSTNQR